MRVRSSSGGLSLIADSPYRVARAALGGPRGAVVGLVGVNLMLLSLWVLLSRATLEGALSKLGAGLLPNDGALQAGTKILVGLTLFQVGGVLLGALYGACQERIPVYGLLAVALFYGLVIWVGGRIVDGLAPGDGLPEPLHTWRWLVGSLGYGLCLGLAATLVQLRAGEEAAAEPLD